MKALLQWIDNRTELSAAVRDVVDWKLPGGAGWMKVWPATLLFTFVVQAITGVVLWMYYSPSAQTAWESVYYVQHEVMGGWLLRGIHHYTAQVMVALAALYVLQMIIRGTYRAPRELVFWAAVLLGLVTMALVLTGDLLPWDQNSFWATQVRVKFLTLIPVVGGELYKLAAGGPAFGHLTVARFFALHAGLFTAAFIAILYLHYRLLRRADAAEAADAKQTGWYWPEQALRDSIACLVVAGVIGFLVGQHALSSHSPGQPSTSHLGAPHGAPADPADAYAAARPEWSLLGVYELSNMFPGELKLVPIFIIPGIVALIVFAMPFVGRIGAGHWFNVGFTVVLLVGLVWLSFRVVGHDRANVAHQAALASGHEDAQRTVLLAQSPQGIPVTGALTLLRNDAKTQGPKLFQQHCASCHDYTDADGKGIKAEKSTAPNLYAFASREWLTGFMDPKQIAGPKYFGNTAFKEGDMVEFVKDSLKDLKEDEDLGEKGFAQMIATLAAEATRDPSKELAEDAAIHLEDFTCTECHKFHKLGKAGAAPDLTGYASREWLIGIISDPAHARFYGKSNDRMPSYLKSPDDPAKNVLTAKQVEILADWLRGTWYEPKVEVQ
ncbi:MAG: cytochrome b N-terminal domain-containing protein [Thermoguttaceae bacterium]